jgi:hypothetical protein
MHNNSQGIRELIDLFIAIGAWAVSIFAMILLLRMFILP